MNIGRRAVGFRCPYHSDPKEWLQLLQRATSEVACAPGTKARAKSKGPLSQCERLFLTVKTTYGLRVAMAGYLGIFHSEKAYLHSYKAFLHF